MGRSRIPGLRQNLSPPLGGDDDAPTGPTSRPATARKSTQVPHVPACSPNRHNQDAATQANPGKGSCGRWRSRRCHDLSRHTDTPGQCCSPCGTVGDGCIPNPCRTPAEKSALQGLATGHDRRDISRSPDAVTCSTNDPSTKPPPSGWLASLPSVFVGTFTSCQLPPILRTQPSATAVGSEVPFSYERRRCPGRLLTQFYARYGPQRPDVPRQPKRHGSVALS